jgi:HNH endonuclease
MKFASLPQKVMYGGELWWRGKDDYYCNNAREKLHRRIYEDNFGPIPSGHVIHHIDHDRGNNSLDNLALMSLAEHVSYHQKGHAAHPAQLAAASKEMRRRWQEAPVESVICKVCGQLFATRSLQAPRLFCSDPCQDRWRANKFKGEERRCERCDTTFDASAERSDTAAISAISGQRRNVTETGSLILSR